MIYGIDVSGAQRGIDIVKLKQLNPALAFVGVKSTGSGGAYVNDDCDRVMQQCFSIGLPCFNYDFTEDGVPAPADPVRYAEGCAAHIQGYAGKAGFVFDWESTVGGSSLMSNADYAAAAVRRMQQLVPSPGFYIDYRTLTNGADWSKLAATNVWKWRASYVYDTAAGQTPFNGFGTPDWSLMSATPAWPDAPAMWQYTSCGYLQGWDGKLDFSAFNGTVEQLRAILGLTSALSSDQQFLSDLGIALP
jgi:GH25 family lysozyme M1 (1,4-beta-N-acetylmuramidase)